MIRLTLLLTFVSIAAFAQEENVFLTRKVKKGIYYTYKQFQTNSPPETDDFECKPLHESSFYAPGSILQEFSLLPNQTGADTTSLMYMLYDTRKKNRKIKRAYAFCDGEHVYINSALYQTHSNYYLKVLDFGRILYTRDPIMDEVSGAVTGVILGGIIGGAVGYLVANKDSRGVVIFYNDGGVPFILNKVTISSILKNHDEELYQQFKQEENPGDEGVLEKYVLLFNQRHP